jgi:hypothetical protein
MRKVAGFSNRRPFACAVPIFMRWGVTPRQNAFAHEFEYSSFLLNVPFFFVLLF